MTNTLAELTKLKKYDIIEVRWLDAFCLPDEPWIDSDDVEDDSEDSQTVAYYVKHTPRFLVVAQSRGTTKEGLLGGVFRIPIGCVLGIEKLV